MAVTFSRRFTRDFVLNGAIASPLIPEQARLRALRALGMRLGDPVAIKPGCFFVSPDVAIGDYSSLEYECRILNEATVTIGARTALGAQVMIVTGSHEFGDGHRRAGPPQPQPVVIGDGVWIGARVTILPGVTIGDGCVIGAGSLVASSCAPNGIYAGVPAEKLRQLQAPTGPPPKIDW